MNKLPSPWQSLVPNTPTTSWRGGLLRATLLFATFIFIEENIASQNALNRSVQVSAAFKTSPNRLEFSWPWDWSEGGYTIYRKLPNAPDWGQPIAELPFGATQFTDLNVTATDLYEYAFYKKEFEQIQWKLEVPAGATLVFTIENIYGNGLCCNFGHGWYLVQGCGETLSGGSDFGFAKSDILTICDNGNPTEELTITINPDMLTNNTWWKLKTTDGLTIDSSGVPGTNLAERPKFGYVLAGNDQVQTDHRGSILLVVDDVYTVPLAAEIEQLKRDLQGDGWKVKTIEANRNDAVTAVKSLIVSQFQQDASLKMVYLLGHVPVPYSGNFYADGHIESHWGAWPADVFYGEMDGVWTDVSVMNTSAIFSKNHNVPGDGKFDQSDIPTAAELAVGRVDLYDMPAFGMDDVELTRRYLNKAHKFKTGQLNVPRRGLVDDNLGIALGAPAASGWRNFAPMFTADSVVALDYFSTMKNEPFLWSFGGGSGSFTSADGVGTTQDFANDSLLNIFTMLCGSYFGDWDNPDNFLRAPLASAGWTLTSCWAGNPPFTLHRMAMGEPIGLGLLRTQNATEADYYPGPQLVQTSLMGDPSLRLHPLKKVEDLTANYLGQDVLLAWSAPSGETVSHYTVSRFDSMLMDFVLLDNHVAANNFMDTDAPSGNLTYMVRAVKWETWGSGSYWNLSLGSFVESQDPCAGQTTVEEQYITICEGQSVEWNGTNYTQSGIYEAVLTSSNGCDSLAKLILSVETSPLQSHSYIICEGDQLMVGDSTLTEPGTHIFTLTDADGCLQHYEIQLAVADNYETAIDTNYLPPIVIDGVSHSDEFSISFSLVTFYGCDSIVNYFFHPIVATNEATHEDFIKIHPNPNNGHFFIESKNSDEPMTIEVWDGLGQQVYREEKLKQERPELELSYLPAGVYWLKIKCLDAILIERLALVR